MSLIKKSADEPSTVIEKRPMKRSATIAMALSARLFLTVFRVNAIFIKSPPSAPGIMRLKGFAIIIS